MAEHGTDYRQRLVDEHIPQAHSGFPSGAPGASVLHLCKTSSSSSAMDVGDDEEEELAGERLASSHDAPGLFEGEHFHNERMEVFARPRPGPPGTNGMSASSDIPVLPILPEVREPRPLLPERMREPQVDPWEGYPAVHGFSNDLSAYRCTADEGRTTSPTLGHRRVHSAPNIMERMTGGLSGSFSPGLRNPSLPWVTSDASKTGIRCRGVPESRRLQAVEPPLRAEINAPPSRPRSWRPRTAASAWGAGPFSMKDPARESSLDWTPKLRASYFVDVRGPQEEAESGSSSLCGGKAALSGTNEQSSSNSSMTTDTRPFEEIKRMRLSQALDESASEANQRLMPSPIYASGLGAHFDCGGNTPRFSPGSGTRMTGFGQSVINCRPAYGGPSLLSPALTEPPTPPSSRLEWREEESDSHLGKPIDRRQMLVRSESDKSMLPMEQRPLDEVNAVQALMSVSRGSSSQPTAAVAYEEGHRGVAQTAAPDDKGATCLLPKTVSHPLERQKSFDDGEQDDDGLDKKLWVVVEKGTTCNHEDCVYRDASSQIACRRHYHSNCSHTHNGGIKKGMVFHHHQLEKVQKHQRSHKREATKSAPYKRTTPEDHQAMEGAGVEGYRPEDWKPEETRQLDELVNQLVAPVTHAWPSIARFFPSKSSVQCLLHWRFTLNDNGIIRGNGTWGAEEDARLRKLAPIFSSASTGPRWAKIAEVMPGRTAKQCRERYNNHVDPAIKKDKIWTAEEDALVMKLHAEHQNQFAKIARCIPGRCYDDVKNRFNLLVKRRQCSKGSSVSTPAASSSSQSNQISHERPGFLPNPPTPSADEKRASHSSDLSKANLPLEVAKSNSTTVVVTRSNVSNASDSNDGVCAQMKDGLKRPTTEPQRTTSCTLAL